jgi:hypothetical protein
VDSLGKSASRFAQNPESGPNLARLKGPKLLVFSKGTSKIEANMARF